MSVTGFNFDLKALAIPAPAGGGLQGGPNVFSVQAQAAPAGDDKKAAIHFAPVTPATATNPPVVNFGPPATATATATKVTLRRFFTLSHVIISSCYDQDVKKHPGLDPKSIRNILNEWNSQLSKDLQ
jgi:hypothetical protein